MASESPLFAPPRVDTCLIGHLPYLVWTGVNTIKRREMYRPLAPSVLAEEAAGWFDGLPAGGSPYMSLTCVRLPNTAAPTR